MDMPPSRYRVVERGRRLVVLDTHRGNAPVTHSPPPQQRRADPPRERPANLPASEGMPAPAFAPPIERGDPKLFETLSWFDDKAPRRVKLSSEAQGAATTLLLLLVACVGFVIYMFGWPLILVGGLLFQPRVRKGLRAAVTKWLDGMEQVAR